MQHQTGMGYLPGGKAENVQCEVCKERLNNVMQKP